MIVKAKLRFLTAFALAVTLALFIGCSPSKGAEAGNGGSGESAPATGSLLAVHSVGQLDGTDEYSNKLCLSCHPRDTINEATEDYGGTEGFNPHKSHYDAGDCLNCHSIDGQSVLLCDECHTEDVPEGWIAAPRGENPVTDLSKQA